MAFELEHPHKHDNLLKFVKTKITYVMSKLTDLTNTWALVKGSLEENNAVRCTIDFNACRMFSVKEKGVSHLGKAALMKCRPN